MCLDRERRSVSGTVHQVAPDYSVVYYGSRIGMYNEIVSQDGIGTPQARIVTRPSKDGAVTFCREYAHDYSVKCVDDGMKTDGALVLTGNCREKTFLDFTKRRFRFLGKLPPNSDASSAEFAIRDVTSGEILDGSSASGYDVELGVFRALCPTASQDAETTEERIHSYAPSMTYNSGQAEFNVSGVFRPRL
jgi:hypothetical protein